MKLKCLIDECLSPTLVKIAVEKGYVASTCLRDRGWLGLTDPQLVRRAIADDHTIVTRNCIDFRGPRRGQPAGLLQREPIHAGFIGLVSARRMTQQLQAYLFEVALDNVDATNELINKALEVWEKHDGTVEIFAYDIPVPSSTKTISSVDNIDRSPAKAASGRLD